MKRILPSFLVLLSVTVHAQFKIIPKVGISMSSGISIDDGDYTFKSGFVAGAGFGITINEKLSVQQEILFSQKGYKLEWEDYSRVEQTATINYLEIPILAKVELGKFYVIGGPSASFGMGGKYHKKYLYIDMESWGREKGRIEFGKVPDDYEDNVMYIGNSFNMGLQLGVGYIIAKSIVVDARYVLGLTNLYNGIGDNKFKNQSVQVTAGFPITLLRKKVRAYQ